MYKTEMMNLPLLFNVTSSNFEHKLKMADTARVPITTGGDFGERHDFLMYDEIEKLNTFELSCNLHGWKTALVSIGNKPAVIKRVWTAGDICILTNSDDTERKTVSKRKVNVLGTCVSVFMPVKSL